MPPPVASISPALVTVLPVSMVSDLVSDIGVDGAGAVIDQVQVADRAGPRDGLVDVLQRSSLLLAPLISAVPDSTTLPLPSPVSVRCVLSRQHDSEPGVDLFSAAEVCRC